MSNFRILVLLLIGVPFVAACGDPGEHSVRQAFMEAKNADSVPGPSVVFRLPSQRETAIHVYYLPDFSESEWQFDSRLLRNAKMIGFGNESTQLYLLSADSQVITLDLVSGAVQVLDTAHVALATLGPTDIPYVAYPNGSIGTIRGRRSQRWEASFSTTPTKIWGTTRDRLLALHEADDLFELTVVSEEDSEEVGTVQIRSDLYDVNDWADVVAVAVDSTVTIMRTVDGSVDAQATVGGKITAVAFSTAGHRVYVATETPSLHIVSRFDGTILSSFSVASRIDDIRVDFRGRQILFKPETEDTVWVADALAPQMIMRVASSWNEDLPAIAPDGTLLVRRNGFVIALEAQTGTEVARIEDSGSRWIASQWDPRRPTLQAAEEVEASEAPDGQSMFVQLLATSNRERAEERARDFRDAGLDAVVLNPNGFDDRYRVVLGPFLTRDEADNIGRRLGQPYFIIYVRNDQIPNR